MIRKTYLKLIAGLLPVLLFITIGYSQTSEDSPFGFHPASVIKPGYPNNGYADAQYIGVKWHRSQVYALWFIVQPDTADTTLNFSMYDQIYGSVPENIHILANIAPQGRVNEGYCLPGSYLPIDSSKYVHFVKATIERYDGDGIDDMPGLINPIRYWQVGNEPLATFPTGFAELQKMTYLAIKDACEECQVLIGGPAQPITPSGFMTDVTEYLDWFSIFYEPILVELNGSYMNIFDFHWYGTADGEYRYCGPVFDSLKTRLASHNFIDIPIWITEMGSYSGDPIFPVLLPYQTEAQQAGDYLKRFVFPLSIGVKKIFPAYGLMEGFKHVDGYFDHTGLIYDGEDSGDAGLGVKKLGYFTYKKMTEKLERSNWENIQIIDTGIDYVYCHHILKNDSSIYVAWYDYFDDPNYTSGDTIDFILHNFNSGQVVVTNAVPYDTLYSAFHIDTLTVVSDSVRIQLSEDPVFIEQFSLTSINEPVNPTIPDEFHLFQNYPNPFNPSTTVEYQLPFSGHVILRIYNLLGQEMRTLVDKNHMAGSYSVVWDGKNNKGEEVAGGVYFFQMKAKEFEQTKKLLLLK